MAAQAEVEGAGPVVLLDADPAGHATDWWQARAASGPILGVWDHSCTADGFERLASSGVELVVVDTPSEAAPAIEEVVSLADLIVIPIRPDISDLEQIGATVNLVGKLEKPFVFLINRTTNNGDIPAAVVIALAQHGTVCPVILPERAGFSAIREDGRTVMDIDPASSASEEIARLWEYLSDHKALKTGAEHAAAEQENQRHFPRHQYDQMATYTANGKVDACRINDISAGGVSMWAEAPPAKGTKITLHIPHLGEFTGEITNVAGNRVGLRFIIDMEEQADLVDQLSGLITPQTAPDAPNALDLPRAAAG